MSDEPSKADRWVYCRRCRHRHKMRLTSDGWGFFYWTRCTANGFRYLPLRSLKTLRWMPI